MTERPDSPYVEDWLKVARRDWHRIHVLLADGDAGWGCGWSRLLFAASAGEISEGLLTQPEMEIEEGSYVAKPPRRSGRVHA